MVKVLADLVNEGKGYNIKSTNEVQVKQWIDIVSKKPDEHKKVRWVSKNQMYLGFKISEKIIKYNDISSWCDVTCGTGAFFDYILPKYPNIVECYGTDIVDDFSKTTYERLKKYPHIKSKCETKNLYDMHGDIDGKYDLVTLSGTLQVLDLDKIDKTFDVLTSLVKDGGYFWLNTIHYGYKNSQQRRRYGLWNFKKDELSEILTSYGFKNVYSDCFNSKCSITEDLDGQYVFLYGEKK